jgi:endonuclease IV
MGDRRFRKIPKVLETPKGKELREDVINLKTLRRLMTTARRERPIN